MHYMNCTVVVIIERPWSKREEEREAQEDIFTFVILCTLLGYYLFLQKIM